LYKVAESKKNPAAIINIILHSKNDPFPVTMYPVKIGEAIPGIVAKVLETENKIPLKNLFRYFILPVYVGQISKGVLFHPAYENPTNN